MDDPIATAGKVADIVARTLNIDPPHLDADLLEMGLIDSLSMISIIMALQQELGVEIDLADIELADFGSINRIAKHVVARR